MIHPRQILTAVAVAAATAIVLLAVSSSATTPPLLGSYDGAGNPAGATAFANQTGSSASIYSDYLQGSDGWPVEVGTKGTPPWVLSQLEGKLGNQRLVLSVPLQDISGESNQQSLASYAANPATWDAEFTVLAQNLVADHFSNAIIRLMWEPDALGTYANDDLTTAANYATVWRDAYTSMAAVSGANFAWAWYWAPGFDSSTNNAAYPGNAYVDYVSLDFYDQSWVTTCGIPYNGTAFTSTQESCLWASPQGYGAELKSLANFAANAQKPMAFGEWGVITRSDNHGGGDDPTFINDFATWMEANNVAWASYFNFNSGGNTILADYPESLAAYNADFGEMVRLRQRQFAAAYDDHDRGAHDNNRAAADHDHRAPDDHDNRAPDDHDNRAAPTTTTTDPATTTTTAPPPTTTTTDPADDHDDAPPPTTTTTAAPTTTTDPPTTTTTAPPPTTTTTDPPPTTTTTSPANGVGPGSDENTSPSVGSFVGGAITLSRSSALVGQRRRQGVRGRVDDERRFFGDDR